MMASRASLTAALSSKSTPSKVGGTFGFLARKAADSGVGILILALREVREVRVVRGGNLDGYRWYSACCGVSIALVMSVI
jgi:hypothetical protein